ncbi:MAG: UDP-N-acetylmuramate--L-alanine ligase [Bdellovibrionales bacterium]|nr:UDP-N-acetylmuramate--L-alanine ligase [Bdellovibrionales bacterium]
MRLASHKIYFIGIGGVGMCGLAEVLHNMGAQVWGSDLSENANTERLRDLGVNVYIGHKKGQLSGADVVVYSSAVKFDHIEMLEARESKIPVIPRAEVLAEIMSLKRGIAIGGSHGKTTTTSLVASVFMQANLKPTIVVGGRLDIIKSTALLGLGEWLIAEADESDGSFLKLRPEISVITNIDNDHMDFYKSDFELETAFRNFALQVPFYGKILACGDDKRIRKALANFPKNVIYYGFSDDNDYRLIGEKSKYSLMHQDQLLVEFEVALPGKHNALNATAAILVGKEAGISLEVAGEAVKTFTGVGRRFQLKGNRNNIPIYDDYAHHPTEIKATLAAFKEKFPGRRIVVAFQPHRYSRTHLCWHDFLTSFVEADVLLLNEIYAAGEKNTFDISGEKLFNEINHKNKFFCKNNSETLSTAKAELQENDVFVTFGAGDIWKVGMELLVEPGDR